jgi:hypothetical protein
LRRAIKPVFIASDTIAALLFSSSPNITAAAEASHTAANMAPATSNGINEPLLIIIHSSHKKNVYD